MSRRNTEADFRGNVDIRGEDECWEWKGRRRKNGYAAFRLGGVQQSAHCIAFELVKGPLGFGMKGCHTCDNPACCNPKHIVSGTQKYNMKDCIEKGRGRRKGGRPYLSEFQVIGVMARLLTGRETQTEISKDLGVSIPAVNDIWLGRSWSYLFE